MWLGEIWQNWDVDNYCGIGIIICVPDLILVLRRWYQWMVATSTTERLKHSLRMHSKKWPSPSEWLGYFSFMVYSVVVHLI